MRALSFAKQEFYIVVLNFFIYFYACGCFMHMQKNTYFYAYAYVCVYTPCTCIAFRGQGRAPDPLHLELWAAVDAENQTQNLWKSGQCFLTTELSLLPRL